MRKQNELQLSLFGDLDVMTIEAPPAEVFPKTEVASAAEEIIEPKVIREFFSFDEAVLEPLKGPVSKAQANIKAIEVLKDFHGRGFGALSDEEKKTVSAYTGWGGLSEVFAANSEYQDIQDRLRELLSPEEYRSAMESVLTAYYTEPHVVKAMWEMVRAQGFEHGRVIEPSVGVGHFIGCMPEDIREQSRVVAVDIDPLSAEMTRALYADSHTFVQCTGIEKTSFADEFDLVIGNVPFGNYRVSDRRLNHLKWNIHEYFVAKAIDMARVGGLIAVIVTSSMLDKTYSESLRYMVQKAKLLKAIRLPSGAFGRLGGTDVVADILLLQKRPRSLNLEDAMKEEVSEAVTNSATLHAFPNGVKYNGYFESYPAHCLGNLFVESGRYGKRAGVRAHSIWPEMLMELAKEPVEKCFDMAANVGMKSHWRAERAEDPTGRKTIWTPGFFFAEDGRLMAVDEKAEVKPQDNLPAATILRLEGMTRIRDCALRLLEADSIKSTSAADIREELNGLYDGFVSKHGYLLSQVNRRLFRVDTHAPLLWSLELWDEENEVAVKADLFSRSTISTATLAESAATIEDGIALSYNKLGRMDVSFIAKAMGTTQTDVAGQMAEKGKLFIEPVTGEYVDALEYLSGDVRDKLQKARTAMATNPAFEKNVQALEAVQPQWLSLDQIETRLGAPWVSAEVVTAWIDQLFGFSAEGGSMQYASFEVTYLPGTASWTATCSIEKWGQFKSEWGTQRRNFWELLRCLLNQQTPEVYDEIDKPDGGTIRVINRDETLACQGVADKIQSEFAKWLSSSSEVANAVEAEYNMRFNAHVNRSYDGSHMVIPGLNPQINLRAAQKDSIWRGIVSGNTLYALAVGGGKTLIQICCAQEYKRLGLAAKPVLVVPNHMLEAFAGEYLRAFPRAKVLAMSKDDMDGERRKTILMRAATNDWDCIIVTHATFGRIAVKEEAVKEYIQDFKWKIQDAVMGMTDKNAVREASRAAKQAETRLEKLAAASKDSDVLGFEEIGIDMILVDEADLFKNLFFFTKKKRIPGISSAFSSRALDLFIKSRLVFKRRGSSRSGLMFSTATPISNSIAEMYIMQTYLQEERLQEMDIAAFDAWAASFAREVTCVEVKPEGSGYRLHTRFSQFVNVPELMRVFREIAEIRTKAMLKLPEPKLNGGAHTIVSVPASTAQKAYVQSLVERAEKIRAGSVKPNEDNMLCVTGDGRKAALDIRCIDPTYENDPTSKVNACVSNVYDLWKSTQKEKATQLVFCDLSVPGTPGFSVYEHIKESLIARGVPESEIAFAQDWKTDAKKAQLHRKVRTGQFRVVVGSTELMGFGTNVQDRLVAKHDLDAPWRPRDVEQRDGRIIRQGNMHDEVWIFRYVTEGTFDAYMWETLERKARFIAQVMESDGSVRRVEDVTSQALSFAEVKAIASGNPIVIEKAGVDAEVAKLLAIRSVYENDRSKANMVMRNNAHSLEFLKESEKHVRTWLAQAQTSAKAVTVNGKIFHDLEEAGQAIMRVRRSACDIVRVSKTVSRNKEVTVLATFGNIKLYMETVTGTRDHNVYAEVAGAKELNLMVKLPWASSEISEYLRNDVLREEAQKSLVSLGEKIANYEREIEVASAQIAKPFEHEQRLQEALARKAEIDAALEIDTDDKSALALAEA